MVVLKNFVQKNVAPGIASIPVKNLKDARQTFGGRILDIKEIDEFSKNDPATFKTMMEGKRFFSKTLAVASKEPLAAYIENGTDIVVRTKCDNEKHRLVFPVEILKANGINIYQKMPFLLINDGYLIKQNGKTFTVIIDPGHINTVGQYLKLLSKPKKSYTYEAIDGVPCGKSTESDTATSLNYLNSWWFGGIQYQYTNAGAYMLGYDQKEAEERQFGPLVRGNTFYVFEAYAHKIVGIGNFEYTPSPLKKGDREDTQNILIRVAEPEGIMKTTRE